MLRNSALIVFALSCLTGAVYYLDLGKLSSSFYFPYLLHLLAPDLCDDQPENMWEMEGNVEKNNIAFIHGCNIITRGNDFWLHSWEGETLPFPRM